MRKLLIRRLWVLTGAFLALVLLLILRLYFLQIIDGDTNKLKATHQYISSGANIYDRGTIFMVNQDKTKIAVATIKTRYVLAMHPNKITDWQRVYKKISEIFPLDEGEFKKLYGDGTYTYKLISRDLTKEQFKKLRKQHIQGLELNPERVRYYPGGDLAPHVIGFVGYDANNKRVGRYGVERYYDDILSRDTNSFHVNFFAELFSDLGGENDDLFRRGNIVLTIDPEVQVFLQKQLNKTKDRWHSKMTAGIVMDPQNGEIIAMAVSPNFDLNNFSKEKGVRFDNPLVSGVYEMGSIIKVLTMAIGLDSGAVKENTTYNDTGHLTLNGSTIHNYDGRARGVVPMQEVLSQSLNVGAAFIAGKAGHETMRKYFRDKLKLGEETGIDLPAEAVGMLANLDSPREIEFATASFGQGVAFTPIATIRALATVSNGGYLVQPHIVKEVEYNNGLTKTFDYSDQKERVFKKQTVEIIDKMLTKVFDEVLAHGKYKMEHHRLSVKTGTAQLASRGGYKKDKYLHTYIGYGPSYNARFIILLMNMEPQGAKYASQTLTEPFINTAHFLINHLNIPPDR